VFFSFNKKIVENNVTERLLVLLFLESHRRGTVKLLVVWLWVRGSLFIVGLIVPGGSWFFKNKSWRGSDCL